MILNKKNSIIADRILNEVCSNQGHTTSQIATELGLSFVVVNFVVNNLAERGYVNLRFITPNRREERGDAIIKAETLAESFQKRGGYLAEYKANKKKNLIAMSQKSITILSAVFVAIMTFVTWRATDKEKFYKSRDYHQQKTIDSLKHNAIDKSELTDIRNALDQLKLRVDSEK